MSDITNAEKRKLERALNYEKPELRIEILKETSGADFWAYKYQVK